MKDDNKTKKQLVHELSELRSKNATLEKSINGNIRANLAVEDARRYAENILETVKVPLLVLDADMNIISANRSFYRTFKVTPGDTLGRYVYDLGNKQWDIPRLRELFENIIPEKEMFDDFEVTHDFHKIGRKVMLLNARRLYQKSIKTHMILLSIQDINERKNNEKMLMESEEKFRKLMGSAPIGIAISTPGPKGSVLETNDTLLKLFGYDSREEYLKIPASAHYADPKERGRFSKLRKRGPVRGYETRFKRKDGTVFWGSVNSITQTTEAEMVQFINTFDDITERKQNEERIRFIGNTLRAIRNVNQLITREKDRIRLIQKSCELMVENRGWELAWILLVDEDRRFISAASDCTDEQFTILVEQMKHGNFPLCVHDSLMSGKPFTAWDDVRNQHKGCDLSNCIASSGAFAARLEHEGKVYGTITVGVLPGLVLDKEEQSLFLEVVTDLSYALASIESEEARHQAEEESRASRERLNLLIFQMNDVVWSSSPDGSNVIDLNESFENIFGISRQEFTSNPRLWIEMVHPDDQKIAQASGEELFKNGQSTSEYRIVRPDGEVRWLLDRKSMFFDKNGSPLRMGGIAIDITERKKAETKLRKRTELLQAILDSIPVMITMFDPQGEIKLLNNEFEKNIGFSLDDTAKVDLMEAVYPDPEYRKKAGEFMSSAMPGEWQDFSVTTRNGSVLESSWTNIRLSDGNQIGIGVDITERKKDQEHLEELVTVRTKDLLDAQLRANEANSAKSDFLARMSHEIRTPMNAIIGMTNLALQTELTPQQEDYISKAYSSAHNLLGIINDILDYSKIEAGKLDIEEIDFDIETVFNNLSNMITEKIHNKGIELIFDISNGIPRHLCGDPLRLGQILINLTNNAMKFTEKGEILVRARIESKKRNKIKLQFSVKDTGIGILPEKIPALFEEFSQADGSTTRTFGGTGLGLAICKRISALMGGTICAESEFGKGSTFTFTAEFGIFKKQKVKPPHVTDGLQGKKVLIVDDNMVVRKTVESFVVSFGFKATAVSSGQDALDRLEHSNGNNDTEPYQLVILDWKMSGMDGIETAIRIKEYDMISLKPKIIMLTAYGQELYVGKAYHAGIERLIYKPVSQSTLFEAIVSVFGHKDVYVNRKKQEDNDKQQLLNHIKGASILLVEDNQINQQVALELLEKQAFKVSIANNGREAVEAVSKWAYDVVLMDIQMPEMDGFEATRKIRENPKLKDLPIIAMTAHAMAGDYNKSINAGMNDHVTKPIDPDNLFETLVKWIKPTRIENASVMETEKEKMPEVDIPSEIPGIDIETGLKRVAGNKKLFIKLLLSFREDNVGFVDEIRNALQEEDKERAKRLVHTVKGVSGTIAATEVFEKAKALEIAIKQWEKKTIEGHLLDLSESLNFVFESIVTIKDSEKKKVDIPESTSRDISNDIGEITVLLKEIKERLNMGFTDVDSHVESLIKLLISSKYGAYVNTLERNIETFDFDKAMETIEEIIDKLHISHPEKNHGD